MSSKKHRKHKKSKGLYIGVILLNNQLVWMSPDIKRSSKDALDNIVSTLLTPGGIPEMQGISGEVIYRAYKLKESKEIKSLLTIVPAAAMGAGRDQFETEETEVRASASGLIGIPIDNDDDSTSEDDEEDGGPLRSLVG